MERATGHRVLWLGVGVSLLLNVALLIILGATLLRLDTLARASAGELRTLANAEFTYTLPVREQLSAVVEVPISEQIEVPVRGVVPVRADIPFEADIPVHLIVPVNTIVQVPFDPGFGQTYTFALPIVAQLPVDLTLPVRTTVPIDLQVPISLTVPVRIDKTVRATIAVPVQMDIPIAINTRGTPLAALLTRVARELDGG